MIEMQGDLESRNKEHLEGKFTGDLHFTQQEKLKMGNKPLTITMPDEQGKLPSDAFILKIQAAIASLQHERSKVIISCNSEWSWLITATLLSPYTDGVKWNKIEPTPEDPVESTPPTTTTTTKGTADTMIVLLGNLPINAYTMTVDSYARMDKAAEVYAKCRAEGKRSVVVCCGGHSLYTFVGDIYGEGDGRQTCLSEAEMMGAWLLSTEKVDRQDIIIEDKSMTTNQNGARATEIINHWLKESGGEVVLVSKADHLKWAKELFVQYPRLAEARLEGAQVDKGELMAQLKKFADAGNVFAGERWEYLQDNVTGLD